MKHEQQEIFGQSSNASTAPLNITVAVSEQTVIAEYIKSNGGVLITEWIAPDQHTQATWWYVLYLHQSRWICVQSALHPKRPAIHDLSLFFPVANRLQRAIYDLTKIAAKNSQDKRPWLSHGYFKTGLLNPHTRSNQYANTRYHFKKVSGDGVHEIPVGPVHAGVIEPGHFRFSVVGERVLKLEERLGYTHKGIHQLLIGKTPQEANKLIGRVSGDTTVAYSYAFALACEKQSGIQVETDSAIMRSVLLERERLVNHIGDIGAIINDTGFSGLAAQFSILKEILVRENATLTGHRYMMDAIVPNQTMDKWNNDIINGLLKQLAVITSELSTLQHIYSHHHGLQNRLQTTGVISRETARCSGLLGVAAKASDVALDVRAVNQYFPYTEIDFIPVTETGGDVTARVNVRFRECQQSIKMIDYFLRMMRQSTRQPLSKPPAQSDIGIGCVEGWRGPVCVAVRIDPNHRIAWCHFHDPSWQNWLALEHAVIDNIVADFPLINKSFNLSYSGQDS